MATSTAKELMRQMWPARPVRLVGVSAEKTGTDNFEQLDMFTDYAAEDARREAEDAELEEERRMQEALLAIKQKFGKNAVLKGANLEEGATAMQRNKQIGGHRA